METLHTQLDTVEQKLADSSLYEEANKDQLKELLQQQASLKQQAEQTEEAWMEQQEALENLEAELNEPE